MWPLSFQILLHSLCFSSARLLCVTVTSSNTIIHALSDVRCSPTALQYAKRKELLHRSVYVIPVVSVRRHLPPAASGCSRCGRPSACVPPRHTAKRATSTSVPHCCLSSVCSCMIRLFDTFIYLQSKITASRDIVVSIVTCVRAGYYSNRLSIPSRVMSFPLQKSIPELGCAPSLI